jgi:hypothetical protein
MLNAFSLLAIFAICAIADPVLAGEHQFHGYYVNRPYDHLVLRPYGEDWRKTGPLPGATALCNDGTSSLSEHSELAAPALIMAA